MQEKLEGYSSLTGWYPGWLIVTIGLCEFSELLIVTSNNIQFDLISHQTLSTWKFRNNSHVCVLFSLVSVL